MIEDRRTKIYWVEVLEGNKAKIVPHDCKGKLFEFINRAQAVSFKDELVINNHGKKFRIVKETTITEHEKWCVIE